MSGRFSRSWKILKSSATVLKQNKKLLVFPLISTVAALVVVGSVAAAYWWWAVDSDASLDKQTWILQSIVFLAMYVTLYSIIIFFNTALVAAAAKCLDGGEPTISDSIRVASSKVGTILGYASIAATLGVILRILEERLGFISQIVAALLGLAWTITTFLVVPILVHQDVGPLDVVKQSAAMLKKTWGENIIANAGMGVIFTLFYVPVILIILVTSIMVFGATYSLAGISESVIASSMLAVSLLIFVLLVLIHAALQSIYGTVLYRYATSGQGGPGAGNFTPDLLGAAFIAKKK